LDQTKLKGTVFPGMGLFDAATPQMRRKRNQRKDGTILEQMKSASASVVPNESVWNAEIELERVRDIYASPSIDGSPVGYMQVLYSYDGLTRILQLSQKGNKKKRKRAGALSERSANVPSKKESKTSLKQKSLKTYSTVRTRAAATRAAKREKEETPEIGGTICSRPPSRLSYDVFRDDDTQTGENLRYIIFCETLSLTVGF
jgi:hypothetical protein